MPSSFATVPLLLFIIGLSRFWCSGPITRMATTTAMNYNNHTIVGNHPNVSHEKDYYEKSERAPYLEVTWNETLGGGESSNLPSQQNQSRSSNGRPQSSSMPLSSDGEEADAAAGGTATSVLKRVSSFSLSMSRSPPLGGANQTRTGPPPSSVSQQHVRGDPHGGTISTSAFPKSSSTGALDIHNAWSHAKAGGGGGGNFTSSTATGSSTINDGIRPSWRLRDRMKTVGVGLVMALNVGTDPPDVIRPHPCAKLQCWMDPSSVTRAKAKEKIGERLEAQYAKWQQQRAARPLKYRRALDPTVEDVRALCLWLRRQARQERILLHYNGHGVPRPTANGEIWVFDKNHTEYIPLSVSDLRQWMGKPNIVVLDCSNAGILIPFLTCPVTDTPPGTPPRPQNSESQLHGMQQQAVPQNMEDAASMWVKDTIVLCPTSEHEWLPMHPDYPADIFTSCLTTPIQIALRWFVRRNRQSMGGLNPEAVDAIPGRANDRKTALGELTWIFTAVTDSIAWNVLPKPLFQRLFRQDLLVASMFRNFLLADRILRSLNCTPQSYPPLPQGVADHPLWQAWDLACETCLFGLLKDGILGNHVVKPPVVVKPGAGATPSASASLDGSEIVPASSAGSRDSTPVNKPSPAGATSLVDSGPKAIASSISSPFFSEQLTAFEIWLEFASIHKATLEDDALSADQKQKLESPEQLPVVLQVLLSQVHRIRALILLRRFLDLGPWAVNLSLSLGIFPYVMKLLQSPEYKSLLVGIWASILKFDPSCQVDLLKDGALPHFIQPLTTWGAPGGSAHVVRDAAKQRTLSAFSLAATCFNYPAAQTECLRQNLHGHCCALLTSFVKMGEQYEQHQKMQLQQHEEHQQQYRRSHHNQQTFNVSKDDEMLPHNQHLPPTARVWLCICLGNLFKNNPHTQREAFNSNVHICLFSCLQDSSPAVRAAVCYALGCLLDSTPWKPQGNSSAISNNIAPPSTPPQVSLGSTMYSPSPHGGAPFPTGTQVLVPQHMSATTMTVPATLSASAILSGQLQPTIGNPSHHPPSMWHAQQQPQNQLNLPQGHQPHPQQLQHHPVPHPQLAQQQVGAMDRMAQSAAMQPGLRMGPPPVQQMAPGQPLLHQQHLLRLQGQGLPQQAGTHPIMNVMTSPHARLADAALMAIPRHQQTHVAQAYNHQHHPHTPPPPLMMNPMTPPMSDQQQHRRRPQTVFDDRRRVELDFNVAEMLLRKLDDGNCVTRYEAIVSLARFVGKYLQAFLLVAEEVTAVTHEESRDSEDDGHTAQRDEERANMVPIPSGVNRAMMDRFTTIWKGIRNVQRNDPHPKISREANTLVSVVHEELLDVLMEAELRKANQSSDNESKVDAPLSGIQEEGTRAHVGDSREPRPEMDPEYQSRVQAPRSDGPLHRLPVAKLNQLRRTASDIGNAAAWQSHAGTSAGSDARSPNLSSSGPPPSIPDPTGGGGSGRQNLPKKEFELPKSTFYDWKKKAFKSNYDELEDEDLLERDPLNPFGAARAYQRRRNNSSILMGHKLANRFAGLAPKPPKKKQGLDMLLDEDDDADDRDSSLKGDLKLREKKVLQNTGVKMTSMLKFHPFENALMVCDDQDGISIWDYEKGDRSSVFRNGNPKGSRMTTSFWINEASSSLFFVGCDDGSARIWDGIVASNGDISPQCPTLAASFFAVPDMAAGQRGSGLICEWQQFSGKLFAGGNSDFIHCWDLGSERCSSTLETNTEACITTLTTAWDPDEGSTQSNYGPEIVVAGHSDGSLRVFDVRSPQVAMVNSGRRSRRPSHYTEHGSWIVDTFFSNYAGRHGIVSGSIEGDIRLWDLRLPNSLRTLDVQRTPMTALSVHKQIPIAASGSHAQFIKIVTLEGETLQVVRFHEEMSGHRIGPVSCLEFHKNKLLLAAGATNSLVSIYKPKHPI